LFRVFGTFVPRRWSLASLLRIAVCTLNQGNACAFNFSNYHVMGDQFCTRFEQVQKNVELCKLICLSPPPVPPAPLEYLRPVGALSGKAATYFFPCCVSHGRGVTGERCLCILASGRSRICFVAQVGATVTVSSRSCAQCAPVPTPF
jgi:hypothetical protein